MNALIQFSVTNFRSFGSTAALSMVAPKGTNEGVMVVPAHPALRLLRVAALFGANASGKSNLLRAMRALTLLARGQSLAAAVDPFRLTRAGAEEPTGFQVDAVLGDTRVTYVLFCTRREVKAEALYATSPGGEEEVVFERETGATTPLRLGAMLGAEGSAPRQFFELNAQGTPRDQLLLRDLALRSQEPAHQVALLDAVLTWLGQGLTHIRPDTVYELLDGDVDEDTLLQTLGDAMSRYDTGVRTLSLHEVDSWPSINVGVTSSRDDLNESRIDAALKSLMNERGLYQRPSRDTLAPKLVELRTRHEGQSTEGPPLQLVDESDGTRRLLNLLPVLLARSVGQCVLIDELDRSLHAAAAQQFVRDFLSARPDDQLIFTTHDTTLLDMPEIPPASVWLVEKDATGCSTLHSLAEVKPEQLAHFGGRFAAGYLQGRFGGVPHLRPATRGE